MLHLFLLSVRCWCLSLLALPIIANAEMSYEERLEMKKRAQKQVEQGQVPTVKPGMSYEERLYIKKKQQLLEQQQQSPPPSQAHRPLPQPLPSPPPPSSSARTVAARVGLSSTDYP